MPNLSKDKPALSGSVQDRERRGETGSLRQAYHDEIRRISLRASQPAGGKAQCACHRQQKRERGIGMFVAAGDLMRTDKPGEAQSDQDIDEEFFLF